MTKPHHHVRQRERMLVAASDLWEVREYIKAYRRDDAEPFRHALTTAMVVTYARCFVKTRKSGLLGYAPLDGKLGEYTRRDWQDEHDFLLGLRHGAVAHNSREIRHVHVEQGMGISTRRPGPERVELLDEMCHDLIDRIVVKYKEILESETGEEHQPADWAALNDDDTPPMVLLAQLQPVSVIKHHQEAMAALRDAIERGTDWREVARQHGIRVV